MCLENLLLEVIRAAPVDVSMLIKNPDTGQVLFSHQAELCVPSASVIKILILVEAFAQLEKGVYTSGQQLPVHPHEAVDFSYIKELGLTSCSYYELMRQMTVTSDNTATNVLINRLGFERINRWSQILGLRSTRLRRHMMDRDAVSRGMENTTSCADCAVLLERIYQGSILTKRSCEEMLRILLQQRDTSCLVRYIFDEIPVAHKTGNLDCVCHDCGIFYTRKGHYIVCVMTSGSQAGILGAPVIGKLARTFYRAEIEDAGPSTLPEEESGPAGFRAGNIKIE